MHIPEKINTIIGDCTPSIDDIGKSASMVLIYEDMVLKIQKQSEESDNEYRIMEWLNGKIPVPKVLGFEKQDGFNYLLMSKIDGLMSCDDYYMKRPIEQVELLAEGMKMLWGIDTADCPVSRCLEKSLRAAQHNVECGLVDVEDSEPETYGKGSFKNPEQLLQWLYNNKPNEDIVLSHGDFCMPNIFLRDNRVSGFIDLGNMGIADRYQDIALCYRSLKSNYAGRYNCRSYGKLDETRFFTSLGIKPDYEKIRYYILLDELF